MIETAAGAGEPDKVTDNYSSMPKAPFAEDVTKLVEPGSTPEATLAHFRFLHSRYRIMDENLTVRRVRVMSKMEEIRKSIEAIEGLQSAAGASREMTVDYELGDTLYCRAKLEPAGLSSTVHLWLGANVMVEYGYDEAIQLLKTKLGENEEALGRLEHDLRFAREQITTMELNVARLHNHCVSLMQDKK